MKLDFCDIIRGIGTLQGTPFSNPDSFRALRHRSISEQVANEVRNTEKEKDTVYRPPLYLEMNVNSINILRHKKE